MSFDFGRTCAHCGTSTRELRFGARFCSKTCRQRAARRRVAGLPESAYPEGAARGRVALGELTKAEHRVEAASVVLR